jgi:hypothetical protein
VHVNPVHIVLIVGFSLFNLVPSLHDFATLPVPFFVDHFCNLIMVHSGTEVILFFPLMPLMQFGNVEFEGALFDQWEGFLASVPGNISMLLSLIAS